MEIRVYQVDVKRDNDRLKFMAFHFAEERGGIHPEVYKRVYAGGIHRETLEGVYEALNCDRGALEHPEKFIGHSLSVSDIVEVVAESGSTFHYVDSIGFKEIEFDTSRCYLPAPITKERIEEALKKQKGSKICPRCGNSTMKERLHTNALSRRADVYICDECGMQEALEDIPGFYKTPLDQWAIAQTL